MSLEEQIELMLQYAQMMLTRRDMHGLWDAAIDIQRLMDKLEVNQNTIKKQDNICFKCNRSFIRTVGQEFCSYECAQNNS